MANPLQLRVHDMIESVGGYWRSAPAVNRVLEELGELSACLEEVGSAGDLDAVADELADVWIITTAIANIYHLPVPEINLSRASRGVVDESFARLVQECGRLARIVNFYDGPKTPRLGSELPTLETAITGAHREVANLAVAMNIDLVQAILRKTDATAILDRRRFVSGFNPAACQTLERFSDVVRQTQCVYAAAARLWGSPIWVESEPVGANVDVALPHLLTFSRAWSTEHLDGFVIHLGDAVAGVSGLAERVNHVLRSAARKDSLRNSTFHQNIEVPGWQFAFGGVRMFVSAFSPAYGQRHPRWSPSGCFLYLQPEQAFSGKGIGGEFADSVRRKEVVRDAFSQASVQYPDRLIDSRVEAYLYVLPESVDAPPIRWWDRHANPNQPELGFGYP